MPTDTSILNEFKSHYRKLEHTYRYRYQLYELERYFAEGYCALFYALSGLNLPKAKAEQLPLHIHVTDKELKSTTADVTLDLADRLKNERYTPLIRAVFAIRRHRNDLGLPVDMSAFAKEPDYRLFTKEPFVFLKYIDKDQRALDHISKKLDRNVKYIDKFYRYLRPFLDQLRAVSYVIIQAQLTNDFAMAVIGNRLLNLNQKKKTSK